ncbi:hypothetical protein [Streptomyces nigrescens]|uniref:hypothetical protein n=1 Tax=Streptomyces nigrescens TaxID=1920 RepID=UPI0036FCC6B9
MSVIAREQTDAAVAVMAARLTDEALCLAWMATEGRAATKELALVRGWIMTEFHRRLGDGLFDEWLMAVDESGDDLDPLTFFARKDE